MVWKFLGRVLSTPILEVGFEFVLIPSVPLPHLKTAPCIGVKCPLSRPLVRSSQPFLRAPPYTVLIGVIPAQVGYSLSRVKLVSPACLYLLSPWSPMGKFCGRPCRLLPAGMDVQKFLERGPPTYTAASHLLCLEHKLGEFGGPDRDLDCHGCKSCWRPMSLL